VLSELEVDPSRILLVLNKVDLLRGSGREIDGQPMFKEFSTVKVSAAAGTGLRQLSNRILDLTSPKRTLPNTK